MPSRNELVIRGNAVGLTASSYPNDSKFEQKILYLEKNGTTYTETLGTGTLTSDATNNSDGETVTVGNRTYTWKTTLSEVKATSDLTSDATAFADGETVNINGLQYTFKTTLSSPAQAFEVLVGVSAAVSLDNLKIAINATGGTEGTEYSVGTYAHPLVTATTNTNTVQTIAARQFGTAPNAYTTGETCAHAAWTGTTLSGGVANVLDEVLIGVDAATSLDNLKLAINNSATEGTQYSTGTKAHQQVTATTNTDTTQVVQARNSAFDNASIATTEAGAHTSWGASTLASGVRGVTAANTTTYGGSAGVSGDKNLV